MMEKQVELCISNPGDALDALDSLDSLESSASSYDSMIQTLQDELNRRAHVDDEFEDVDFGATAAIMLDYETNYTLKQLKHVAAYYGIKYKPRKADLIQDIVLFECDTANSFTVARRKRLFFYMDVLKADDYLKSYVIM